MAYEEINTVLKPIDNIDIRFGLISPNEYNRSMQTLDYQLLYQLNERKDCFCERVIYPSVDRQILTFLFKNSMDSLSRCQSTRNI